MARDAIQIDSEYYFGTMNTNNGLNKLADAVMDVGPSPCMKFNCPNVEKCKTESVECKAFRFWVNNGALETYSKKEGGMVSIEKDVGRILRIIE